MNNITLNTKSYCPYANLRKRCLSQKGVSYTEIDVANDTSALLEMFARSNNRRTVLQLFFDERHIVGYGDLVELNQIEDITKIAA